LEGFKVDIIRIISEQITSDPMVFNESGYSRVRRILLGDVPSINTVGIFTAQNPQGKPPVSKDPAAGRATNNKLNMDLFNDLKSGHFGPIMVRGRFGNINEESFLVPNITRSEVVMYAKQYNQESAIFGTKKFRNDVDDDGEAVLVPYFEFEYVQDGVTIDRRSIHLGGKEIQDLKNNYTEVKGRKFLIPFFDESGAGEVKEELLKGLKLLESFSIPFFDDPTAELTFYGRDLPYYSHELPHSREVLALVEEIKLRGSKCIAEGMIGRYYYEQRGMLGVRLRELKKLVGLG